MTLIINDMKAPDFEQDFFDMIESLESENCKFLIVGGYAMAFNGYIRATGDIDILVKPDKNNSRKVIRALKNFGAPISGLTASDFEKEGTIFQIGLPPVRIDIITKIDGVSFNEAFKDRKYYSIKKNKIPYISIDIIIKNKRASGREKDILDIKELMKWKIK